MVKPILLLEYNIKKRQDHVFIMLVPVAFLTLLLLVLASHPSVCIWGLNGI